MFIFILIILSPITLSFPLVLSVSSYSPIYFYVFVCMCPSPNEFHQPSLQQYVWVRLIVWSQENGQLSGDYITKENISLTHKHLACKLLEKVSFYKLSTFYYSVVRGTILCGSQASNHCFPEFSSITVKTFPEPTFHNTSFSSPGSDLLSVLFPMPFHELKRSVIDVLFMAGEFCSRSLSLL